MALSGLYSVSIGAGYWRNEDFEGRKFDKKVKFALNIFFQKQNRFLTFYPG